MNANAIKMQNELRRQLWESLFRKYERRVRFNKATCLFSEVNYKLLRKPLSLKFKLHNTKRLKHKNTNHINKTKNFSSYDSGVDVSWKDNETDKISKEITNITHDHGNVASKEKNHSDNVSSAITNNTCTALDSSASCNDKNAKIEFSWGVTSNVDTHSHMIKDYLPTGKRSTSCTDTVKVNSTPNNDLEILIRLVEHDLKSELRTMMTNRRISLLLESEDYDYWHKCTKKEIRRLEKYISRDNLTKYMCYYFTCNIPEHMDFYSIEDLIVNKMKSNLKTLILKRGLTRTDTDKYLMYQEKIYLEWQRLLKEIPEDYVIFYTENISTDD